MKKSLLAATAILTLSTTAAFASPINDLGAGQTAIGIGTDMYIEHQLSKDLTIGYQNVDRDYYHDMQDVYGQFRFTENLRGIVGHRNDLPYDSSNFYAGLGVYAPLTSNLSGYASYITGSDFDETQIGTNIALTSNIGLNVNYHSFNPDHGRSENKFGFGANVTF